MNPAIFKAYDVRGKYPEEINEKAVAQIAKALAGHFQEGLSAGRQGKVIIGHDARLSSPSLYKAVIKGIMNSELRIMPVGLITTPMLYFLVNHFKAVGGIMVTASHNPKEYNGLKVVGPKAEPMSGKEIQELIDF